jgi:hypothetical protein
MANRHSHKKLRLDVRRRMALSGESYQKALREIQQELQRRTFRGSSAVDLIQAHYFGVPIILATFEAREPVGRPVITRVPSAHLGETGLPPPPFMMVRPRGVQ